MTDSPLVSIIMPLYNAEPYLVETFDSVLSQSYKNWELIVVEDCSSDASLRLAKEYENKDRRISVHPNEHNVGASKSRNTGIEHVSGDFVAFMDADDAWISKVQGMPVVEYCDKSPKRILWKFTCDLLDMSPLKANVDALRDTVKDDVI